MNKTMQSKGMTTLTTAANGALMIHVPANVGESAAHEQFEGVLKRAIAARSQMIMIDLSEADSVSTIVLGSLLNLRKAAAATGCDVRLVGVQPMVRRVLNICRLDQLFYVCSSFEEAMNAV